MDKTVIVSVKEGKLRGIENESKFSGVKFYSFYKVPYGESTEKNSRFKDPVKVKPWRGIRDATTEKGVGCTQYSVHLFQLLGSEDCLYHNIHTPKLPSEGEPLKPVIVFIHPGRMLFGSPESRQFGAPDFIMHNDVVYVCIAFRLHILGFLNLKMEECSGNQGLKDIILGLKWIKENIHQFNGDPNNVTVNGHSSGAVLAHLMMLSPAARGLFDKVVLTAAIFFVYAAYKDENETLGFEIARKLGFKGTDPKKLLRFLRKVPAEAFVTVEREYERSHNETSVPVFPQSLFLPTIDFASTDPVIPISPRKLIDFMTTVPMIFGVCEREAIFGFGTPQWRSLTEQNYKTGYRQNEWSWMRDLNDDEMRIMNDEIEAFYLEGCHIEDASLSVKVNMMTEIGLHDLYDTLINPIAEKLPSSVFIYKFQFESEADGMKALISTTMGEKINGTYHASDCCYWSYTCRERSPKADDMIRSFTKLITTFAKNGDPNYQGFEVKWRPSTVGEPCFLSINDEMQMVDGELFNNSVEFWKNIKKRFKKY